MIKRELPFSDQMIDPDKFLRDLLLQLNCVGVFIRDMYCIPYSKNTQFFALGEYCEFEHRIAKYEVPVYLPKKAALLMLSDIQQIIDLDLYLAITRRGSENHYENPNPVDSVLEKLSLIDGSVIEYDAVHENNVIVFDNLVAQYVAKM